MSCCMMVSVNGTLMAFQRARNAKGMTRQARADRDNWQAFWRSCTDSETGKDMTEMQVLSELFEHQRLGHRVMPGGHCPNWSFEDGCQCDKLAAQARNESGNNLPSHSQNG